MTQQVKKNLLEAYGLIKVVLGTAQLTSLFAGYFFWEWIAQQEGLNLFIVPSDTVALVCLAVFVRSLFHIISGAGIACIRNWARHWLLWGWPVMLLITYGVTYALWTDQKSINAGLELGAMFVFWKVILYLVWMIADMWLVNKMIRQVEGHIEEEDDGFRLKNSIVTFIFFATIIFVVILLFAGKSVQGGFHQGFYKMSGAKALPSKVISPGLLEEGKTAEVTVSASMVKVKNEEGKQKEVGFLKKAEPTVDKSFENSLAATPVGGKKIVSTKIFLGYAAGICLFMGLVLLGGAVKSIPVNEKIFSFMLMAIGFVLWMFYGWVNQISPLVGTGLLAALVCLFSIGIKK